MNRKNSYERTAENTNLPAHGAGISLAVPNRCNRGTVRQPSGSLLGQMRPAGVYGHRTAKAKRRQGKCYINSKLGYIRQQNKDSALLNIHFGISKMLFTRLDIHFLSTFSKRATKNGGQKFPSTLQKDFIFEWIRTECPPTVDRFSQVSVTNRQRRLAAYLK